MSTHAQTVDPQQILKELEEIEKGRRAEFKVALQKQMDQLAAAAQSPQAASAAYEDAVQAVEFDGKPKNSSEFADWREKSKDMLTDADFQEAAQLHLQYLVLSLKRLDGQKIEDIAPALIDYVARVAALKDDMSKRDKGRGDGPARPKERQEAAANKMVLDASRGLMNKSLGESVFVRWYRLEGHLGGLKDWEMSSGNFESIIDRTIMPYLRDKKDPRLITFWDERIARQEADAKKSGLDIDLDKYENQTLPTLVWRRAEDKAALGQRSAAIADMFGVIKGYQAHPDFQKWAKELRDLIGDGKADAAPPAAAATAPAAPAAN